MKFGMNFGRFEKPAPLSKEVELERITEEILDPEGLEDFGIAHFFDATNEDVTAQEFEQARERMRYLFGQLAAGLIDSSGLADRSYKEKYRKVNHASGNLAIQWHDIMHAAVMYDETKQSEHATAVPRFVTETQQINNESLIRDEVYALLFPMDRDRGSPFRSIFLAAVRKNPEVSFDTVFDEYMTEALHLTRNEQRDNLNSGALRKPPGKSVKEILKEYDVVAEKIKANPDPEMKSRAERIYSEWKKGNKRALFNEFLAMSAPEHQK